MYYTSIDEIKIAFLYNAILKLSNDYSIECVHINQRGELLITFSGKLKDDQIKYIKNTLIPKNIKVDFAVTYHKNCTHVITIGFDYRTLDKK